MAGEVNTIKTVLKYGTSVALATKLCPVKDYPDLGGSPEMIEITDLDDDTQRFLLGVQSIGAMEFTANYVEADFTTLTANSRVPGFYVLEFGNAGADGKFTWQGQHVAFVTGGSVNGAREMKIVIAPSTKVTTTV